MGEVFSAVDTIATAGQQVRFESGLDTPCYHKTLGRSAFFSHGLTHGVVSSRPQERMNQIPLTHSCSEWTMSWRENQDKGQLTYS